MTLLKELSPDDFFSKIEDSDLQIIRQRSCGQSINEMAKEWREIASQEHEVDIVGDLKDYLKKDIERIGKKYGMPWN